MRDIKVTAGVAAVTDFSTSSSDVVSMLLKAAGDLRQGRASPLPGEPLAIGAR